MKLDDLHPMVECKPADIQSCHDRIESLEDRLACAKELLVKHMEPYVNIEDTLDAAAFIAKLNKEGL